MKSTLTLSLPTKLRQLRMVCGYSKEFTALTWGISQAAVSKLESGKSVLTIERVQQAAAFYHLSIDELVHDDLRTLSIKAVDRQFSTGQTSH